MGRESERLAESDKRTKHWKRWGPYVSERQWATVREDYSGNGDAWSYFTYEDAITRCYRWGEDGIAGVSDTHGSQCLTFAFWNEKDDILKERLFGLTSHEGNHGEDVKEEYAHLDNTPTHSYMEYQYKYPQSEFPYQKLREENGKRSREEPEYELSETGVFEEGRYFDIFIEMGKHDTEHETMYFKVTVYNRGPEPATIHVLPQLLFRNVWAWGSDTELDDFAKPELHAIDDATVESNHEILGKRYLQVCPASDGSKPTLLFTDNETNKKKMWGEDQKNASEYTREAFHDYVCDGNKEAVNPKKEGTKMAAHYVLNDIPPDKEVSLTMSFAPHKIEGLDDNLVSSELEARQEEADEFYYDLSPLPLTEEMRTIQRQAFAGMLWNKQYYEFIYGPWIRGDANAPIGPPPERKYIRNTEWRHLHIDDILSMPDKWEYPFFAAWDTSFHCLPLAMVDSEFAKKQLVLLTRDWYMHPNGQLPAYEWNFSDVNPPVHAWATFRVYKMEHRLKGVEDTYFLEEVFQKLLINFTWWVNRKDANGKNVFEGGFLGMDNIGLFNRSEPLPTGGQLEQADGTGWMGFYCVQMLNIALELAKHRPVYEHIASKFFEHFLFIADAISHQGNSENGLWNEQDGFYYDRISYGDHKDQLPVKSFVGLVPLFASLTIESDVLRRYPKFARRVEWFVTHRPKLSARNLASLHDRGQKGRILLSLVNRERLERILSRMLDETEFLSPYGIRSLSKYHQEHPYSMDVNGELFTVDYQPAESNSGMFGGNSNWRGPVWFPTNFLLVESLQRDFLFYGDTLKVEFPTGSGESMTLDKVAEKLQHRLIKLFLRDDNNDGRRPFNGGDDLPDFNPLFDDFYKFHEYFNPDTGKGLGTQHQCGWTGLVAKMLHDTGMTLTDPGKYKEVVPEAAQDLLDDIHEARTPRSRHRNKKSNLSSRSSSISRVVANIGNVLDRYNLDSEQLVEDLESKQDIQN